MAHFKGGKKTLYYKKSASSVPPPKVSIGPDIAFCAYQTLGGSTPHLHPDPRVGSRAPTGDGLAKLPSGRRRYKRTAGRRS